MEKAHQNYNQAKLKAANYCVYQDRTQKQVREKLENLGVSPHEGEQIIAELIQDNFINEERFAKSYAHGKFSNNKWGKVKIKHGLEGHQLSPYCVKKGLENINQEEYINTLHGLAINKMRTIEETHYYKKYQKIKQFLLRKGYENDLIEEILQPLLKENQENRNQAE